MEIVLIGTTVSRSYLPRNTKTLASWRPCAFALKNQCPQARQKRDLEIAATFLSHPPSFRDQVLVPAKTP